LQTSTAYCSPVALTAGTQPALAAGTLASNSGAQVPCKGDALLTTWHAADDEDAGATPLLSAAYNGAEVMTTGDGDAIVAVLLAAGASASAVNNEGDTCLSLAAAFEHMPMLRQLLRAWAAPADALVKAAKEAAEHENWEGFVLLLQQLAKQDRAAALDVLAARPQAVPELLRPWVSSDDNLEQKQQVMQQQRKENAQQQLHLQEMVVVAAGLHRRAAAAGSAAPIVIDGGQWQQAYTTTGIQLSSFEAMVEQPSQKRMRMC
jgi:hypothetical protein